MIERRLPAALFVALSLISCRAEPAANVSQSIPASPPQVRASRIAPSGLELVPLEVRSRNGTHHFIVEVARSPAEQAQGLMYRSSLGDDEGMIFPFQSPRPASFWMRNTLIPLDMIFIRADGTIARVAANTVPLSEETVTSGEPVAAVLEIRGGRAAELGITEEDRVSWQG